MKRSYPRSTALALLAAVALAGATGPATGGDEDDTLRLFLDPPGVSLGPGASQTLALRVEGVPASGLAAFQVVLAFDPDQLEVRDPNAKYAGFGIPAFAPLGSSPLCAAIRGTAGCPDPAWMLTATGRQAFGTTSVDIEAGTVTVAYATAGDEPLATGSGTLALLEVVGRTGGQVDLEIVEAILADASDPPRPYPW